MTDTTCTATHTLMIAMKNNHEQAVVVNTCIIWINKAANRQVGRENVKKYFTSFLEDGQCDEIPVI